MDCTVLSLSLSLTPGYFWSWGKIRTWISVLLVQCHHQDTMWAVWYFIYFNIDSHTILFKWFTVNNILVFGVWTLRNFVHGVTMSQTGLPATNNNNEAWYIYALSLFLHFFFFCKQPTKMLEARKQKIYLTHKNSNVRSFYAVNVVP